MTTTAHLQVYDAVVAALSIAPALSGGVIKTMRDTHRPMDAEVPSQIRVLIDKTSPSAFVGGGAMVDWTTRIRLECLARDVVGLAPLKALDAATLLAAQCQSRILQDAALQALVIEVLPGPMQWGEDEADTALIACIAVFTLVHRTAFASFTA